MMKFTIGLAIIAFTLILGSYKFLENSDIISAREGGLRTAIARKEELKQFKVKIGNIKKNSMVTGQDQKFNIERMLKIDSTELDFSFTGQGRNSNNSSASYRHSFRISGPADFVTTKKLIQDLSTLKGFMVNKICYACKKSREPLKGDKVLIQIEGLLYVYNPNKVK